MTFELLLRDASLKSTSSRAARWRLCQINLRCQEGERIGIIGSNGAGKSSLASVLCGLDRPTKGHRVLKPVQAPVMLILQRPEEHFLAKTIYDEVAGYARQKISRDRIDHLLSLVGLDVSLADCSPRTLSGGQQRALSLACGLATSPALLILDEPMAGLDAPGREQVMRSLRMLNQIEQMALCVISHHPDDLQGWAERLLALEDGKLIYDGPFPSIPGAVLDRCIDTQANSLFVTLRRLEEAGHRLPPAIYQERTPEVIAKFIEGSVKG